MHALRATFALFLLAAPVAAQQVATYGDHVVMPTFGVDGQDHATLAVNHYGDVFTAWHSGLANGSHMVEGMVMPYAGGTQWTYDTFTNYFLFGDPALGLIGQDTCLKPDVAALEDGSFVVAWARTDELDHMTCYLEMARVEVRDALGQLLPVPSVTLAQAGQGVVLDATPIAGQANLMVDLVTISDRQVAAVYGHESNYSVGPGGEEYRDYDLRALLVDWAQPTASGTFVDGPYVLAADVPMDNRAADPLNGGVLLPDVVLDDNGNLVVAWEGYFVDGHNGVAGADSGWIEVARFQPFQGATPLGLIDTKSFLSPTNEPYRRPNLSSSREDLGDTVTLGWMEVPNGGGADSTQYVRIDYSTGVPMDTPGYWVPPTNLSEDQHPVPLHAPGKNLCVATRTTPNTQRRMLASWDQGQRMVVVQTPIAFPWRPAVARHAGGAGSPGPTDEVVFVTYEGANTLNPSDFRVRVMFRRL